MRILLINSEFPPIGGGASNASAHLVHNLNKLGHEVQVLTAAFSELPRQEMQSGVLILRIPAGRRAQDRSNALEQGLFMLSGAWYGWRQARTWRPDIVIAFFGVPSGVPALFLKVVMGIPYIVSMRGGDVPGFRPYDFATFHRLLGPLIRLVWRKAGALVANSDGLRELGLLFNPKADIQVIPNGVEASQFTAQGREWSPPQLFTVGRVVYQKGTDLLLEALNRLQDLEWELSVAGDGPFRPELEAQAARLGIADRVHFLGWQDKAGLKEHYRRANLFVYPSRHEGMPNAVLEAMASGLPVVASQIAGNEELVLPGKTGLLIPSEDIEALTEAIRELLPNTNRRQKMGAAARRRVERSYTWMQVAQKYSDISQKILEMN